MRWAFGIAGLAAVVSVFLPRPHASASQAQTDSGRVFFATYCATCHGSSGHGDGPVAESLRVRPADLTQLARRNKGVFPTDRTRSIVDGRDPRVRSHGTLEMPVWGDAFQRREGLSEDAAKARIDAIVRYVGSIQERPGH